MLNKGKILWCIWAGILVLLFLMSSTDLIITEKKVEVYPISVIVEGDNDDYYVNFKKGMDQAAVEFHGDVSFITLYAPDDQAQQMELVKREIRDGTRAVILAPVKTEEAVKELEDMSPGCPVILLGQPPLGGQSPDTIGVDGREVGRLLGGAAAYQDTYRQAIEETDSPGGGRITIIALDVQSLDQATRILEENTIYQGRVAGLYGAGSTTSLLRALDRGIVTGMTAYNQFDQGYLSVKQAVEAIQGTRQKQQTLLEAIYVDEDKLRDKTYEKMLYPIE